MASDDTKSTKKTSKKPVISQEKIINDFNELRGQQRGIATKITELEAECKEHDLVIEALKGVDPTRRCFRMIGGVLVERKVSDVLPELHNNREKFGGLATKLTEQLEVKGKEINEFRECHNIRVRGEESDKPKESSDTAKNSQGVLVGKSGTSTLDSVD